MTTAARRGLSCWSGLEERNGGEFGELGLHLWCSAIVAHRVLRS